MVSDFVGFLSFVCFLCFFFFKILVYLLSKEVRQRSAELGRWEDLGGVRRGETIFRMLDENNLKCHVNTAWSPKPRQKLLQLY